MIKQRKIQQRPFSILETMLSMIVPVKIQGQVIISSLILTLQSILLGSLNHWRIWVRILELVATRWIKDYQKLIIKHGRLARDNAPILFQKILQESGIMIYYRRKQEELVFQRRADSPNLMITLALEIISSNQQSPTLIFTKKEE